MAEKKRKVNSVSIRGFGPKTNVVFNILIGIFALSCLLPFFFVIIISLTSADSLIVYGYQFWPHEWSVSGYTYLASMKTQLFQSLGVSVFITVVGTVICTTFTSTYAYALSRSTFRYRRFFTMFALITMLFSPGMVANYIVMTNMLGLKDSIWALILPAALNTYNLLVMRTFFKTQVSDSIIESARIDGASEFRIFVQIVIPLAIPGIATISLFSALGLWNDWFNALLYIESDSKAPLQYLLMKIQNNLQMLTQNAQMGSQISTDLKNVPLEASRMAMVVISTVPIAITYPFFQKYFTKGFAVGGVKE